MNQSILFSIIIPNYNKADNIQALLSSVYSNYHFNDFEVFFMDDASTDSSVNEARLFPVKIYSMKSNVGPAALRNMAAKESRGEYLLFFDSDVILADNTLTHFRDIFLAGKVVAVSGLEVLPPVIDNWIGHFRTLQVQDQCGAFRTREAMVNGWGAVFGAIRRDVFMNIGGFDECYKGADIEDHVLAARLGGKHDVLFSPELRYRHSYPSAFGLFKKQFLRASQMVRVEKKVLTKHSFFGWRFRMSHLFVAVAFAGGFVCLFDSRWIYLAAVALMLKAGSNYFLLYQALKTKGLIFAAYCFMASLIMSLFVISGALFGAFCIGRRIRDISGQRADVKWDAI